MNYLGIETEIRNLPALDKDFLPLGLWFRAYTNQAKQPLAVAVERENGKIAVVRTAVYGTPEYAAADRLYVGKLVKLLLWMKGGFRIFICGDVALYQAVAADYSLGGSRDFDVNFMARVYGRPFEVVERAYADCPEENDAAIPLSRTSDGCRIGFDAGGSDRKVSALIDGEVVFSEEVIWHPKEQTDPAYHLREIVSAFRSAAAHLPRVDGIGVSSAGVIIDHKPMISSLFIKVPDPSVTEDIYLRAAKELGDIPIVVCNDGDVSAMAGGQSLGLANLLGVAMGTSVAVGYLNQEGDITGWLNELAFAPVDLNPAAMADEWSGDIGCGCKYFSQDAVVKLAPAAGLTFPEGLTLAEKLSFAQERCAAGDPGAEAIFTSIGTYFGHTLALYHDLYGCGHVLILGRVMSGRGGELVYAECSRVLADEYPQVKMELHLPDEKFRRLGQSAAAALLPRIRG